MGFVRNKDASIWAVYTYVCLSRNEKECMRAMSILTCSIWSKYDIVVFGLVSFAMPFLY